MMKQTCHLLFAILMCGCSSVPRFAERSVVPRLSFSHTPPEEAIRQLSVEIVKLNPSLKGIEIDRTPTTVVRPSELDYLARQMDQLESRYLASIRTDFGEPFVTFSAEKISVHAACRIMSQLLGMHLVYRPTSIIFRFGPTTATFRRYTVQKGMVEALETYPDDGWNGLHCFERPPPWNGDSMMSLDDGTAILVVGSEDDQIEFKKELKKRRNQQLHRPR